MCGFDLYLDRKIENPLSVTLLLTFFIFIVYVYQGIAPAFNADDIIQLQYPEDTINILVQGRWGYAWIFGKLFASNPVPVIASLLGAVMLAMTGITACRLLGFHRHASVMLLVTLSSISVYYGDLFSFDSTRVAFPLANLLAVYGLYLSLHGRRLVGIFVMSLAPAFYSAAPELAATLFFAYLIVKILSEEKSTWLRDGAWGGVNIGLSLLLYLLITKLMYYFLGVPLGERTDIDVLALIHRSEEILCLFNRHSFPLLSSTECAVEGYPRTITSDFANVIFVLFLTFNLVSVRRLIKSNRPWRVAGFLVLQLGLIVMPYVLIFASKNSPFPPRSLYAFGLVHGFYAAYVLEEIYQGQTSQSAIPSKTLARFVILLGALLVCAHAVKINASAFDEYLGSNSDILMANRILARVESVVAEHPQFDARTLPISVISEQGTLAGPRGDVGSVFHVPWARERIFHLLDRRIVVATDVQRRRAVDAAKDHKPWPAADAVFVLDDFIVVVISK